jgi:hypothetical protein
MGLPSSGHPWAGPGSPSASLRHPSRRLRTTGSATHRRPRVPHGTVGRAGLRAAGRSAPRAPPAAGPMGGLRAVRGRGPWVAALRIRVAPRAAGLGPSGIAGHGWAVGCGSRSTTEGATGHRARMGPGRREAPPGGALHRSGRADVDVASDGFYLISLAGHGPDRRAVSGSIAVGSEAQRILLLNHKSI